MNNPCIPKYDILHFNTMEGKKMRREDFNFLQVLGRGAYARVLRAQRIDNQQIYAIKIVEKALLKRVTLIQEKKEQIALAEKNILSKLSNCPGVVKLHHSFQDPKSLYFVLDYCPYGDFYGIIRSFDGVMPYNLIQHYTAELVVTLEYVHRNNILHRDLKPENILIGPDYHIKVSDFGASKDLSL